VLENVFIRLMNLPVKVHGFTVLDNDSNYNVYINSLYSYEEAQKTLNHELNHIKNGDFYFSENVYEIEKEQGS